MIRNLLTAVIVALVCSGCVDDAVSKRSNGACAAATKLLQSTGDSVGPIVIKIDNSVNTLPQVFSSLPPVLSHDGTIHGIALNSAGEATQGYDFEPCQKKLALFPLPKDLNGYFHEIAINPDAQFVAYVAHSKSGKTWGVVRSWPEMEPIVQTSPSDGYPSDVGGDKVEWTTPNEFRISYRLQSGRYVVLEGDPGGRVKIDTLAAGSS